MTDTKQIEHCDHPVAQPLSRNDVIEECARTCNERASHHASAIREEEADECADAIRALKQQAPESASALKFANHIINGVFEGGDWDGGELQSLAVQYGLLKPVEMKEPCAEEGCQCVANGADFPAICYRKTYLAAMGKEKP